CARCHDHKYDRVTQQDYYGLQAFFAGTLRGTRDLPGSPSDPGYVADAYRRAHQQATAAKAEREELRRDARELVYAKRRCDVAPDGTVKITDDEINKMCQVFHPGRLDALEKELKAAEKIERFYEPVAESVTDNARNSPKTYLLRRGEIATPGP